MLSLPTLLFAPFFIFSFYHTRIVTYHTRYSIRSRTESGLPHTYSPSVGSLHTPLAIPPPYTYLYRVISSSSSFFSHLLLLFLFQRPAFFHTLLNNLSLSLCLVPSCLPIPRVSLPQGYDVPWIALSRASNLREDYACRHSESSTGWTGGVEQSIPERTKWTRNVRT